jgi:hypothetical protein
MMCATSHLMFAVSNSKIAMRYTHRTQRKPVRPLVWLLRVVSSPWTVTDASHMLISEH